MSVGDPGRSEPMCYVLCHYAYSDNKTGSGISIEINNYKSCGNLQTTIYCTPVNPCSVNIDDKHMNIILYDLYIVFIVFIHHEAHSND